MKTKGQQPLVAKLEPLACVLVLGGLAEWSNAVVCKTTNGAQNTVQGFESLTRLQIESSLVMALTTTREKRRTAEAARLRKFSIRLLAVKFNRRFHTDLSQLPDRDSQIRKA